MRKQTNHDDGKTLFCTHCQLIRNITAMQKLKISGHHYYFYVSYDVMSWLLSSCPAPDQSAADWLVWFDTVSARGDCNHAPDHVTTKSVNHAIFHHSHTLLVVRADTRTHSTLTPARPRPSVVYLCICIRAALQPLRLRCVALRHDTRRDDRRKDETRRDEKRRSPVKALVPSVLGWLFLFAA